MARGLVANRGINGAAYFAVMGAIILVRILPVEIGPGGYPSPDFMICITFALLLRRPHFVPTPLIALAFLLADLLFMRPPGLHAAIVVLAAEYLRAHEATWREWPFMLEWSMVAVALTVTSLLERTVLAVFAVSPPGLVQSVLQLAATILAYPLIVLVLRQIFGIAKMTAREADNAAHSP